MPAGGSLFCFQLALALSLGHRLSSHIAFSPLSLGHRLGFAARPASVRCPVLPYVREREKLPFLPLPVDPGNFLLSQAVPSSVPSAFGGLTSVFGMGTGGALQLSSPETFLRGAPLASRPLRFALRFRVAFLPLGSLPPPRTFKTAQVRVDQQTFTLLRLSLAFPRAPSASAAFTLAQAFRLRSASTRFPRFRFALTPHLQNCTGSRVDQLVKHSSLSFFSRSSPRPISIAKLHTLPCFHRRPIYLIVSEGSYLL